MPFDGLVSDTIAALVNGVSEQPPELRLTSQNESQVNCLSDVVRGVRRRPPFEHVKKLVASPAAGGYYYHLIDRDENEQYILLIEDDTLKVYDLAGNEKTVGKPADMTYFNSSDPASDFRAITVADYTFILNRTITVATDGSASAVRPNEFLWIVDNADSGADYKLTFGPTGPTIVNYTASAVSTEAARDGMYTLLIASAVASPNHGGTGSWTFSKIDHNTIYAEQTHNTGSPETIRSGDDRGDTYHRLIYKKVQNFGSLPKAGKDGMVITVEGDDTNEFDEFYVKYVELEEVWQEVAQPGLVDNFNLKTMPYTLVRTPGGGNWFELTTGAWAGRAAGDANSAPNPTFVGRTISDLLIHKNRMCFLTDENVVTTEAANFFNFWPTTATTVPDGDPIDAAATSNRVTLLDWALPFARHLTVISAGANFQGELVGRNTGELTAADGRIEERGNYAVSSLAPPQAAANHLFLPIDRTTATGFYEYKVEDDQALANENTSHVPTLIPGSVTHTAVSITEGTLVALSTDTSFDHRIYVYRWHEQEKTRLMSSWSYWETAPGDKIRFVDFIVGVMWAVIERGDGLHLEKLDLRKISDGSLSHRVYLDDLVSLTGVYTAGNDTTTWTMPYDQKQTGDEYRVVRSNVGHADAYKGRVVDNPDYTTTASQITALGDHSAGPCLIGRVYTSEIKPSQFYIREQTQFGHKPITLGRLQIRRARLLLAETGTIHVDVTLPDDSEIYTYHFTGLITGVSLIGPITPTDAVFEFDVGGENRNVEIRCYSDTHLPFNITGIEWEGFYFRRGSRA